MLQLPFLDNMILRGKKVLITGGARGLGLEMAKIFARRGAHIIVADRSQAAVDEVVP